jgi:hypothetical protein
MDDSLKRILDEFERLKGQFVITDNWDVQRLIAIGIMFYGMEEKQLGSPASVK